MRVLQVCTFARGGAGKAALSYHRELLRQGIDATILFRASNHKYKGVHTIDEYYGPTSTKLRNLIHKVSRKIRLSKKPRPPVRYSFHHAPFDITKHPAYKAADLIHLHWTYELLDFNSFLRKNTKPVIWTQHDECILFDGCHYAAGFPLEEFADYRKQFRRYLVPFLQKQSMVLTAPSSWLTNSLKENEVTGHCRAVLLPNGLETTHFKVKDRTAARTALNLPTDKKIVLFIADFLDRKLKGLDQFIKMIQFLKTQGAGADYLFVIVGHGTVDGSLIPLDFKHIAYVDGLEKMSLLYNAADVYVTPTYADNLPYTVMESLFCGTPVAGFDVGGLGDLVLQGNNGLLSKVDDVEALGLNTVQLMTDGVYLDRGRISLDAVERFSVEGVTGQLIQLYKEVLSGK